MRLHSLSHDQSFSVTGNNTGIFYSDNTGKILWKYNATSTVDSISISPDGSFVSMCTDTGLFYFDRQGILLWHYETNNSTLCTNVISSDLGYVLAGDTLSNNTGDLYVFNNTGALLWKHTDVPTYTDLSVSQNITMSSDGLYQVEVTGQSNRGYGLTVSYYKLEHASAIPEFQFALPILLVGITSLILLYRPKSKTNI
ncbi:MAG: PQQ-binding-like beta-propeller repeat protein [Thaumarchaeota archaeon]|nr:PQQ-binding-like beta-propeller repeat protein [Nitrososphaerota archaeon]MDE1838737.1 PQQ-binding-like beta-propeller repeat protein [Nitrososphaerota archaeon]